MKFFSMKVVLFSGVLLLPLFVKAQGPPSDGRNANALATAAPFLNISPDSRSGAMGDAGVALSPDVNATYWNPSKLAFLEDDNAVSISYSPWLRNLVPDISLSYLSYAHKVDDRNTIGASLRYFDIGNVDLTDALGGSLGNFTPSEFSIDGSIARKFGETFSLGLTVRFIHSSLSNGIGTSSGGGEKPGNALAADVSFYYKTGGIDENQFSFGADMSNIGTKISYSTGGNAFYLPTNLKIGAANTWNSDDSQFTLTVDLNKLLVPTQPNSSVSVPAGIFQSFTDAGISQEFKEIYYSAGAEYWYNKAFALRAGYYYESPDKGGRQYLTLGVGFKYQEYGFDFSYLAASQQNSPLANTLRFTLSGNFGGTK